MSFNVGTVTGLLELDDQFTGKLRSAADDVTTFETKASTGFRSIGGDAAAAGTRVQDAAEAFDHLSVSEAEADRFLSDLHLELKNLPSTFSQVRGGLNEVAEGAGLTVDKLGLMNAAGAIVGAGYAGWHVGRAVADFFGLDDIISRATASLLGFGDVAAEEAGAKADVLARASKNAGFEVTNFTAAMRINADAAERQAADWNAAAGAAKHLKEEAAEAAKQAEIDQKKWDAYLQERTKALEALYRAERAHTDATTELLIASGQYREVLEGIDGEIVEGVKFYLEAGASQTALATAYGLTAIQIKAVAEARKDELAVAKTSAEFRAVADARQKELTQQETAATNDLVIAKLKRQQADDTFLKGAVDLATAFDRVAIGTLNAAGATEAAAARTVAANTAATNSYWAQVDAALAAHNAALIAAGIAPIPSIGQRPPSIDDPDWPRAGSPFGGGPHPLRDAGGPVTAGQSYLIGLNRQPEIFTPGANGFVTPMGAGGGVTVHIQVSGVLDPRTIRDLTRGVSEEILNKVKPLVQLRGS